MDKQALVIEEYKQLSSEILSLTKINYSILLALISITGTIIGFVVAKELMLVTKLLLLALINVFVALGFKIICTNRGGLWKKSYYISIFIEKAFDFVGWQTHVSSSREERDKSEGEKHRSSAFYSFFIYFKETHEYSVVVLLHIIPSLFSTIYLIDHILLLFLNTFGKGKILIFPCFKYYSSFIFLFSILAISLIFIWSVCAVYLYYTYRFEKKYRGGGEISKKWKEYWLKKAHLSIFS